MPQTTNNCPFCDKTQSYRYITETDHLRVIYPKNPDCAYHVLIVPKKHIENLNGLPEGYFGEVGQLIKQLANKADLRLGSSYVGFNMLSNNGGVEVNQHVNHCHIHLFLRTVADKYDPIKGHVTRPIHDFTYEEKLHLDELRSWFK